VCEPGRETIPRLEIRNKAIGAGKQVHGLARILLEERLHGKLAESVVREKQTCREIVVGDMIGDHPLFEFRENTVVEAMK
jgi:hypothetical protein